MKYFILITDGEGDYPLPDRDKKTPLQLADNPVVNELAHRGTVGRCRTIPNGMEAGSDVGHLSLLGYPPEKFHTGRAPLEAASMGIELADNDITFRGNIVTLRDPSFNDNSSDENSWIFLQKKGRSFMMIFRIISGKKDCWKMLLCSMEFLIGGHL